MVSLVDQIGVHGLQLVDALLNQRRHFGIRALDTLGELLQGTDLVLERLQVSLQILQRLQILRVTIDQVELALERD